LLAEGYHVIGFDIERHRYARRIMTTGNDDAMKLPAGNSTSSRFSDRPIVRISDIGDRSKVVDGEWDEYPAQLVLQDVLTLHGSQFRDADLIVASPPCQGYSYRAMPWKRAKALPPPDNSLFEACFRIQREACEAAGRHIPMVVENVRGAQKWVGRSRWNFGSFHLWGDVPALMPIAKSFKVPGFRFDGSGKSFQSESVKVAGLDWSKHGQPGYKPQGFNVTAAQRYREGVKVASEEGRRTDVGKGARFTSRDCGIDGVKNGNDWFGSGENCSEQRRHGSKSDSRKAASAQIAKIPFALSSYIARVFKPA
jgi:hypothetical protein